MAEQIDLKQGSIGKLLWQFSAPAIVGMLVGSLYNIISRAFVGKFVNMDALSGVQIAYPISLMLFAFSMLITIGATALISIRLGERDIDCAQKIVGNAFTLLLIVSFVLAVVLALFCEPILRLLGATPSVLPYAKEYVYYTLPGVPLIGLGYGMNNFIRAEGHPRKAMMTQLMGAVVSVGLTALMVPVLHFGVKGAAIASCFAQAAAAIWVLHHLISKRVDSTLRLRARNMRLDFRLMRAVLGIGMAPFAAQAAASLVLVVFNNRLGVYGGDIAIAAYGAIGGVVMVLVMPLMGLSQGVQPIVGFNYGARQYGRVKKAECYAMIAATGIALLGFVAAEVFPRGLLQLFGGDAAFLELGVYGLRADMCMYLLVGAQIVGSQYFQATGRGPAALVLTITRQFLFLIPLLFLLPHFFGLNGVWFSNPVADVLSFAVTMTVFGRDIKKLNRAAEQTEVAEGGADKDGSS